MKVVGELVLVLALLVSVCCELRARDPDVVEEEEEKEELRGRPTRGAAAFPPHMKGTVTPHLEEGGSQPAQRGYKLSTHAAHRQKQTAATLLGCCCQGHNCDDRGVHQQRKDLKQEQGDHGDDKAAAPTGHQVHNILQLVMEQLQPLLQGFNRSLEHLSQQVAELARNKEHMRGEQQLMEVQATPLDGSDQVDQDREDLEARLEQNLLEQAAEVRWQMEKQRTQMENRLHSQHVMLHHNLTSFKADVDLKLKRHQKMLQVSLQAMNATLAELKLVPDQPSEPVALWEAIKRLDNLVVNNTVEVHSLVEDMELTSGTIQLLRQDFKGLVKQINQTARTSQVQFMETGLEVEAAKEVVLRRVAELAGNLSQQSERLQEMDVDVDYLYTTLYKDNSSSDCGCKSLKAALARLERGVANVTALANKNQLALEEDSKRVVAQWGGASEWEPAVQVIQQDLQQVKEALVLFRTQTLDSSLAQLNTSLTQLSDEVSVLNESNRKLADHMQHWSGSFKSLLKDVIRHSDALGLLLGEEVSEFLEWPVQDHKVYSIPVLREQLALLQEQLKGHNLSISSLLAQRSGTREEVPSADQPSSSSLSGSTDRWTGDKRTARRRVSGVERQPLPQAGRDPEHRADGSGSRNLERMVDELKLKVLWLEQRQSNTSAERGATPSDVGAKLQAELAWLKKGLEEHLRMFKNVFSNADLLEKTQATLELDKLWNLIKSNDGKKEKKKNNMRGGRGRKRGTEDKTRKEGGKRQGSDTPLGFGLNTADV